MPDNLPTTVKKSRASIEGKNKAEKRGGSVPMSIESVQASKEPVSATNEHMTSRKRRDKKYRDDGDPRGNKRSTTPITTIEAPT